jgi:hypothetical protein
VQMRRRWRSKLLVMPWIHRRRPPHDSEALQVHHHDRQQAVQM